MKLGDALSNWMRTGVKPSESEIQRIAMLLNSIQLNNVPAVGWPTQNEINYKDIVAGGSSLPADAAGVLKNDGAGALSWEPAIPAAYTPSNVTTDRVYDANATTLDEISDVLGTLIADLKALGFIA